MSWPQGEKNKAPSESDYKYMLFCAFCKFHPGTKTHILYLFLRKAML